MPKKYNTLFPSENAYRVVTVLLACCENGEKEVLLPDIARGAKIHYSVVLYWINVFDACSFINVTRYKNRENANCMPNRHVIVHLTNKAMLGRLYNYMWLQRWEWQFMDDLSCNELQLVKKIV